MEFNDKFYVQRGRGLATGTKCAPTVADLTMGYLEIKIRSVLNEKLGPQTANHFYEYLKRFLDDGILWWPLALCEPQELLLILNTVHPHIKFEMSVNAQEAIFLSLKIKKVGNEVEIDINYKKTDAHAYLTFSSSHPYHTRANLPFNLFRRIHQIVENEEQKNWRMEEMKIFLLDRGYPRNLLDQAMSRVLAIPQSDLRLSKQKIENKNALTFVTTHNPANPEIKSKVSSILQAMTVDDHIGKVISNKKTIWAHRQPANLFRLLCSSKLKISNPGVKMINKCGGSHCELCEIIIETSEIEFENGITFHIKSKMNCNSLFLIYVLICDKCGRKYIGETENLRDRINNHKKDTNNANYRKLFSNKHFHSCSNNKFHFAPLFKCHGSDVIQRKQKEDELIKKLKPSLNCDSI